MPFPTVIDNILGLGPSVVIGPYQDTVNNNIFALLVDGVANTGDLQSYVSTDNGVTWSIADSAHHPVMATVGGFSGYSFGATYDSSARLINVIYANQSPGFSFINFDTAAGTWGTPINSGSGTQFLGTQTGGSTNGDVWGRESDLYMGSLGGGTYIFAYSAAAHFELADQFVYTLTSVFNGTTFTPPVIVYASSVFNNAISSGTTNYPIGVTPISGSQAVLITQGYLTDSLGNLSNFDTLSWVIDGTTSQLGGSTLLATSSLNVGVTPAVSYTTGGTIYTPHSDFNNFSLYSSPYPSLSWTQTVIGSPDFAYSAVLAGTTTYLFNGNSSTIVMYTNTGLGWSSAISLYTSPDTDIFNVSAQTVNGTNAIVFDDVDTATFSMYKTKYFTGIIVTPTSGRVLGPLNLTY